MTKHCNSLTIWTIPRPVSGDSLAFQLMQTLYPFDFQVLAQILKFHLLYLHFYFSLHRIIGKMWENLFHPKKWKQKYPGNTVSEDSWEGKSFYPPIINWSPSVLLHQAEERTDSPTSIPGLLLAISLITHSELEWYAQPLLLCYTVTHLWQGTLSRGISGRISSLQWL